jgi:hypothetical protein
VCVSTSLSVSPVNGRSKVTAGGQMQVLGFGQVKVLA